MEQSVTADCMARIFKNTVRERDALAVFLSGAKQQRGFYERMKNLTITGVSHLTGELLSRLENLQNSKGAQLSVITMPPLQGLTGEAASLMETPLTPSSGTQFSSFIIRMGNADWVRQGIHYADEGLCPFCQQTFGREHFMDEFKRMFDETYQQSLRQLQDAGNHLAAELELLQELQDRLVRHQAVAQNSPVFAALAGVRQVYQQNLQSLLNKAARPSETFPPAPPGEHLANLTREINALNAQFRESNRLADNHDAEMAILTSDVNDHLRMLCDETLQAHEKQLSQIRSQRKKQEDEAAALLTERQPLDEETSRLTGQLSVIQPTIDAINANLISLGIKDFSLCCHDEKMKLYRLQRNSTPQSRHVFKTLSEGEKTIIALLYFIESCTGNVTPEDRQSGNKIIVIDDPISSLSHNYIYEVASLIKLRLIRPEAARHLVILTHNMFFFQEILLTAVRRLEPNQTRPKGWTLLRIVKNEHSQCIPLSMHEMLNEYQALWQTLKDVREGRSQPVVLPNTMRNILEYYFSFSCKEERLGAALDSLEKKHNPGRFDSFFRAINRHSHADGRNIISMGVIGKDDYFRLFREVFVATDDLEHYCAMMDETK